MTLYSLNVTENICKYLDYKDLKKIKKILLSMGTDMNIHVAHISSMIKSLYTRKYIYYVYSLAYGNYKPIIIDTADLGLAWKTALQYAKNKQGDMSSLEYFMFDMYTIKMNLEDDCVELSAKSKYMKWLESHFPDYFYFNNKENKGYVRFSYEKFYQILPDLKKQTVNNPIFPTDDPFPSWLFNLEPVKVIKSHLNIIMIFHGDRSDNCNITYKSSNKAYPMEDIEFQPKWPKITKVSYPISSLKEL